MKRYKGDFSYQYALCMQYNWKKVKNKGILVLFSVSLKSWEVKGRMGWKKNKSEIVYIWLWLKLHWKVDEIIDTYFPPCTWKHNMARNIDVKATCGMKIHLGLIKPVNN